MSDNGPVSPNELRALRVSRAAIVVFLLSIVAAFGFFLVIPPLLMFVAALVVRQWIGSRLDVGGQGYAVAAAVVSACALLLGLAILVLISPLGRNHVLTSRGTCAANLRGIVQSMNVYASDNSDSLPIVSYAPYSASLNNASGKAIAATVDDVISGYMRTPNPQAGSLQACLWILVMRGDVAGKQFLCKSDPFAGSPAQTMDAKGRYFDNFQNGHQLSYSIAYPWMADGTVGGWWKSTSDASLPVMADMTPEQGTGTPVRNVTPLRAPADLRTWNSANHQGEGQTVGFADGHADFARQPTVGYKNDNIYSTSGVPSTGPAEFGGKAAGKYPPMLTSPLDTSPFDTIMLPVRNETTGGM